MSFARPLPADLNRRRPTSPRRCYKLWLNPSSSKRAEPELTASFRSAEQTNELMICDHDILAHLTGDDLDRAPQDLVPKGYGSEVLKTFYLDDIFDVRLFGSRFFIIRRN